MTSKPKPKTKGSTEKLPNGNMQAIVDRADAALKRVKKSAARDVIEELLHAVKLLTRGQAQILHDQHRERFSECESEMRIGPPSNNFP